MLCSVPTIASVLPNPVRAKQTAIAHYRVFENGIEFELSVCAQEFATRAYYVAHTLPTTDICIDAEAVAKGCNGK